MSYVSVNIRPARCGARELYRMAHNRRPGPAPVGAPGFHLPERREITDPEDSLVAPRGRPTASDTRAHAAANTPDRPWRFGPYPRANIA